MLNQAHVENVDAVTSISLSCYVWRPYTKLNWVQSRYVSVVISLHDCRVCDLMYTVLCTEVSW